MTRATTPGALIHATAAEAPELSLAAAIVWQAVTDARDGCPDAREWLASADCLRWLAWLAPNSDPAEVQRALVASLPDARPYQTSLVLDCDEAA